LEEKRLYPYKFTLPIIFVLSIIVHIIQVPLLGSVIEVTNLNDSGSGSLRAAVQASGARTVVFRVSGTIALNSRLEIDNDNITIAGQTAPGDGICIRNRQVTVKANNVIIRYLRFRLGDELGVEEDALHGRYYQNIIIDHCSASWSVDECVTFYDNTNLTIQWCLISESLHYSVHSKGAHGYGGIWGGMGASFHHNMLAHHYSRNPRFNGSRYHGVPEAEIVDHRNNVIYNWGGNSAYAGEEGNQNLIANYYKYGPASKAKNRIVQPYLPYGSWYIDANYVYGYPEITADNWAGGVQGVADQSLIRAFVPHSSEPVVTHTAENAYELVLADVGVSLPTRDSLDSRIIEEARTGTATYGGEYGADLGIIDTQTEVGGWPQLNSVTPPDDNDHDGMADQWELDNGLDPTNPDDRNGDFNGDGYTNLEKYLTSLCVRDDFLMAPGELGAATISDNQIDLNWKENVLEESGFIIERSQGDTNTFVEITSVGTDETEYTDSDLQPLTTYYYRVRAYRDQLLSIYSNVDFTTTLDTNQAPLPVSGPSPKDSSVGVNILSKLSWTAAIGATSYDVYFGNSMLPEYIGEQEMTIFDPQGLSDSTTYYWRIDSRNNNGLTTGPLWQFTTEIISDELVAHWPLDRGAGALDTDASGNGHYIYLQNMDNTNWVPGFLGSAISFNGPDQHLLVRNSDFINFSIRGFTISFWLLQSDGGVTTPWISKGSYSENTWGRRYQVYDDVSGKVNFVVADDSVESRLEIENDSFLTGEWVMVTVVRDEENKLLILYRNGDFLASAPDSTGDISQINDLFVGGDEQQINFLTGIIDDIRIYNYALSAIDIENIFQIALDINPDEKLIVPRKISLRNYPNPFNNMTQIEYTIPKAGDVDIKVYNLLGQVVFELVDEQKSPGKYTLSFDASDLSSGIYIYRLSSGSGSIMKKMVLIK
jgi:hypothetical protein